MHILSELKIGERIEIESRQFASADEQIVSQVIDIRDDSLLIINPIKQGIPYPLTLGHQIKVIFYRGDKGIFRFNAVVKKRINKSLIIYEIVPTGEADKIQRRFYYRLELVRKVVLKPRDQDEEIDCMMKDISGGGMKVYSKTPLSVGTKVDCTIHLRDNEIIKVSGRVVRSYREPDINEHVIGISFKDISENTRSKIVSFIFERQRLLRKKGLI
ncbi:flagellar brake protein [Alkaliphilus hydrothermalis]|uniref:C-di-GMP-binding flagellar brake protein YcgR n=1 Tax=Alkaliphilus hydrothermalis TaxID=1482730 RepID=A0ABS2NL62_9FIRM|nr:PilZ domain-containing protein [Alkaliphilus hydrothermalis]MBM7613679.1 c-di-GMP-binding flagellar brake protein YcgR [Alkaliphilus hydrothermalis]